MSTRKAKKDADNLAAVLEKIAAWREPYNAIGERLHEVVTKANPDLKPRTWYGMPGYAKDGPVLCFFRVDDYMTFGLTEKANFKLEEDARISSWHVPGSSRARWTLRPRPGSRTSWRAATGEPSSRKPQ